jgi:hypothetical protein
MERPHRDISPESSVKGVKSIKLNEEQTRLLYMLLLPEVLELAKKRIDEKES